MIELLQETEQHSLFEDMVDIPRAVELIDNSLTRIEELSEDEIDRQLANLILCAKRVNLPESIKVSLLEDFKMAVPAVNDLIDKIQDTADHILSVETLDADSSTLVVDLGVAADITQDKSILEHTLDALHDTDSLSMDEIKKALTIAYNEDDKMFIDVYRSMKAGKKAMQSSPSIDLQPPDEAPDIAELRRSLVSGGPYEPPRDLTAKAVTMESYDDLYDGNKRYTTTPSQAEFTLYETVLDTDKHHTLRSDELEK